MADITDSATRSRMMSAIKGKNTNPEIAVRKALHKFGLRYRLHVPDMPGKPDLVFPRYRTVLFVHGCFWHLHGCSNSNIPRSRTQFWTEKLNANKQRDAAQVKELLDQGWRVAIVWECSIRRAAAGGSLFKNISKWIRGQRRPTAEF